MEDYGRSAFDVRNRLFLGGTMSLPHAFRISPFLIADSGSPFDIIVGQDLNGDSIFNDRPALVSSGSSGSTIKTTAYGTFNTAPLPGQTIVPINYGSATALFTLNLRLSKTFGLGPKVEGGAARAQGGGPPGGGPGGGHGGGGRGPWHGLGELGGPGGPFTFGNETSRKST